MLLQFTYSYFLQEMLAIIKSIYDMMGSYTYPSVKEYAAFEHVEIFFQVLIFDYSHVMIYG